jgi:hypothetical protein
MTYDGGRKTTETTGVYLTDAPASSRSWAKPQLIFNDCRDHGFGEFIHYYVDLKKPDDNICPGAVTGNVCASGPAGPTIGDQNPNNAKNSFLPTTRGSLRARDDRALHRGRGRYAEDLLRPVDMEPLHRHQDAFSSELRRGDKAVSKNVEPTHEFAAAASSRCDGAARNAR